MKSISESFEKKSILLTGATGFLGKVVLEKLLRSSPGFARIHLLIRAEDLGHSMNRMENDIFSSSIFHRMKAEDPANFERLCRQKIRFVIGDTSQSSLGLDAATYLDLLTQTDLVINVAASTDFAAPIDTAILTNTLSVRNVTEFVAQSRSARLLHVSTCYVNEAGEGQAAERMLKRAPANDHEIPKHTDETIHFERLFADFARDIDAVRAHFEAEPEKLKQGLIELGQRTAEHFGWHNVYTFTKWLGERSLERFANRYHCTVVRPSIIESCLFEPVPGWIEGFKVADPLFYGSGVGMIKALPGSDDTILDLIPVDLVGNAILIASAELLATEKPVLRFYQSCSGSTNPLALGRLPKLIRQAFSNPPPRMKFFLPPFLYFSIFRLLAGAVKGAQFLANTFRFGALSRSLKSTSSNLRRLDLLATLYRPYMCLAKTFENRELLALHARASAEDRLAYPVDAARLDWDDYLARVHIPGLAKFVLQDSHHAVAPKAKKTKLKKVAS